MSRVVFGLYDEMGYMQLLADYLEKISTKVESHLFTRKAALEEYLKGNEVEVLLLGEEVDQTQISYLEHVKNLLVLSEEPVGMGETAGKTLFKYQSAQRLVETVFEQLLGEEISFKEKKGIREQTKIYGVYRLFETSPVILERLLSKEVSEGKTLILDFGLFGGVFSLEQRQQGMSELLFYLKQPTEKIVRKLPGLIQEWQGVDYLCPVEDYRDLYGITPKEVDLMLQVLSENTEYENVICDIGFLSETTLHLMEECDFFYLCQPRNQWEQKQRDGFLQLLQKENMEKVISKLGYLSE